MKFGFISGEGINGDLPTTATPCQSNPRAIYRIKRRLLLNRIIDIGLSKRVGQRRTEGLCDLSAWTSGGTLLSVSLSQEDQLLGQAHVNYCPACKQIFSSLETYHITYSPERTIELCHLCHLVINPSKRIKKHIKILGEEGVERRKVMVLFAIRYRYPSLIINEYGRAPEDDKEPEHLKGWRIK